MVFGACGQPLGWQYRLDDLFHHRFLQIFQRDIIGMLGGQHHGINTDDFAIVILERDLAFGVWAQPRQGAIFTHFGLALNQTVGISDWCRHQHVGFIRGITEHQALIASTLLQRIAAVNTLVDIR
ncbi:hypothetical protein D3C80_1735110 [compost metagenome]